MIIDAHLDLAYNVIRGRDVRRPAAEQPARENEIATVGLPDLRAGNVDIVFATIFCIPKTYREHGYSTPQEAYEQAQGQLDIYDQWEREGEIRIARTSAEVVGRGSEVGGRSAPTHDSRPTTYILLEGAAPIRTVADAQHFYDRGVRIVGLSWGATQYSGGTGAPGPLTPAGKELVKEFDRLGILHDASHLAERSFWDLTQATDKTIVASHSNCRSIVLSDPRERHLTDAMIRAIAERGGVVGINLYDKFLLPFDQFGKRRTKLDDVCDHIKHVCDLTGNADHVAIGTDMDGGVGREQIPEELTTIADLKLVGEKLAARGFAQADIEKINSGNWLRMIAKANWSR